MPAVGLMGPASAICADQSRRRTAIPMGGEGVGSLE